jgi:hypothetical protein
VWPTAAPQKAALAHYGWNTVIEGLWHGVPMALWPRYAEQHLNAFALGATVDVTKLERAVWVLMGEGGEEGRRVRAKAREMMAACRKAVGDGGSSSLTLKRLCNEIIGSTNCVEGTRAPRSPRVANFCYAWAGATRVLRIIL